MRVRLPVDERHNAQGCLFLDMPDVLLKFPIRQHSLQLRKLASGKQLCSAGTATEFGERVETEWQGVGCQTEALGTAG